MKAFFLHFKSRRGFAAVFIAIFLALVMGFSLVMLVDMGRAYIQRTQCA